MQLVLIKLLDHIYQGFAPFAENKSAFCQTSASMFAFPVCGVMGPMDSKSDLFLILLGVG